MLGVFTAGVVSGSAVSATAGAKVTKDIADAAKKNVGNDAYNSDSKANSSTLDRGNGDFLTSKSQK